MTWFGPGRCNCQCCKCRPRILTGCLYACDNGTTGVDKIYATVENYPAGTFISYSAINTWPSGAIKDIVRTEITGWQKANVIRRHIYTRSPIRPGYNSCDACEEIATYGSGPQQTSCCFRRIPWSFQLSEKWEMKCFAEQFVAGTLDPCLKWLEAYEDLFSTDKTWTASWGNCGDWTLTGSPCPNFGTSANAIRANAACPVYRAAGPILPPLELDLEVNLCEDRKIDYFFNYKPCASDVLDQTKLSRTLHVEKTSGDNQFALPVAYEVIISNLPNKYYWYKEENTTDAIEITGLDEFNGTYYIEAASNGCIEEDYIENIDVGVAAYSISTYGIGPCTITPYPSPFPATGQALLRIAPIPRVIEMFLTKTYYYDWINITVDDPFDGSGTLSHQIYTFSGITCSETDNSVFPNLSCLPNPNPYFRIRIKPIYAS